MTVSNTTRRVEYACNGSVHDFGFAFPIDAAADLVVVVRDSTGAETVLTLTTDYEISTDVADDYTDGGTVTTVTYASGSRAEKNWGSGNTLIIYRDTALTQDSTYFTNRGFRQENIERNLDKLTMIVQELADGIARSVAAPTTDDDADMTLPNAVQRAGKYLYFDSNGLPTVVSKTLGEVPATAFGESLVATADGPSALTVLGATAFGQTLLSDSTAAAARATLGVVASSITNVDDYAAGDGTTDDTAAIEAAIAAAAAGSILMFGPKTYKITDEITISKALILSGYGYSTKINQVTASKKCFIPTVSNVKVYAIWMNGVGHNAYDAGEIAVDAYGASYAAAISNIRVEDCHFSNWGNGAVQLKWVTDFSVFRNKINGVHYFGVQGISVVRGDISGNVIDDLPASADTSWNAYGIILSRDAVTSLVTDPRPTNITVCRNVISNVTTWEGIDTHGGENVIIQGNTVKACKIGINVSRATDGDNLAAYAPKNVAVLGNTIDSGITNGQSVGNGIIINGAMLGDGTLVEYAYGCTAVGNTVVGHGQYDGKYNGGIYAYATTGLVISANSVRQCARSGIVLDQKNRESVVKGNSIQDIFADTDTNIAGIYVSDGGDNSNFLISDNTVSEHASGATYKLTSTSGFAVLVANTAGNSGKVGLVGGAAGTDFTTLLGDAGSKVSKNLNA